MPSRRRKSSQFVVCIRNGEYDADLVVGKIYPAVTPEANDRRADIRVVDESGKGYLFPRSWFVPIDLPLKARKAIVSRR